jgi:soluble cytochrome b562|tara:strand:+ start:1282 stop:1482 length:201 start_codon:yes stop_codon:yes gene_type:complete
MSLYADEMEKIVTQVARGEKPQIRESKEATEFREGVTNEIEEARKIAEERGLDFMVEIINETPEMW